MRAPVCWSQRGAPCIMGVVAVFAFPLAAVQLKYCCGSCFTRGCSQMSIRLNGFLGLHLSFCSIKYTIACFYI